MGAAIGSPSLQQLERIGALLAAASTEDELARAVVAVVEDVVALDYLAIYMRDPETGAARMIGSRGFTPEECVVAEATAWDRHPGRVVRTGERIVVADIDDDDKGTVDSPRAARVRSRAFLPVRSRNRLVGAFGISSTKPNAFSEQHLATLDFACSLLGAIWETIESRKQSEALKAQLERTQRLEIAGRVAGSVAHDFNNLLSIVVGQAGLLDARHDDKQTREQVQAIKLACARGALLTRRLLGFTDHDRGAASALDLRAELARFRASVSAVLPESVHAEVTIPDDPVVVRMDATELEQVLLNLVLNAADAMPGGGAVRIGVERLERIDGAVARLSVRDSGAGVPQALRGRIFEPFVTDKALGKGTGLGLAVVKSAVERIGGSVAFRDAEGGGTVFELDLPCVLEAPASTTTAGEALAGSRVLVVEDEALLRTLLSQSLEDGGFEVTCAADGAEALEWISAQEAPPTRIVTDILMPRLNGVDFIAQYAESGERCDVVFITGYEGDARLERLRRIAPNVRYRLLRKPFRPQELLAAFEAIEESAA